MVILNASGEPVNRYSSVRTRLPHAQGMLHAVGFLDEDFEKAQVDVCSSYWQNNPCDALGRLLGDMIADRINKFRDAQGRSTMRAGRYDVPGQSDGQQMGIEEMRHSLPSRDLMAMQIHEKVRGSASDALVSVVGCDKTIPAGAIALALSGRPGFLYNCGTISPGCVMVPDGKGGKTEKWLDIVSIFEAAGQYKAGKITLEQYNEIRRNACPSSGNCGGMYTANTMVSAFETMGLLPTYNSSYPATGRGSKELSKWKKEEIEKMGEFAWNVINNNITLDKILTKKSFENGIAISAALGGSTNLFLHLLALVEALKPLVHIELDYDDFQRISDRTPLIGNMKPFGTAVMEDLFEIGGVPAVQKYLLQKGKLHGDCLTVTGKTLEENLKDVEPVPTDRKIIFPVENPIKPKGHFEVLYGNIAPGGIVFKLTESQDLKFVGAAVVYESEGKALAAFESGDLQKAIDQWGKIVAVIRNEGPRGAAGMPEMLDYSSKIKGAGLDHHVALVTDGRFSGGTHGNMGAHAVPEAYDGGPIALIETGDKIIIDATKSGRLANGKLAGGTIDALVTEEEFDRRRKAKKQTVREVPPGWLPIYREIVWPANKGAVAFRPPSAMPAD